MDMDDDDFLGEIEFDLTPTQRKVVTEAIDLASRLGEAGSFASINPLIVIMQWWEAAGASHPGASTTPEERLVAICREFVRAHAAV